METKERIKRVWTWFYAKSDGRCLGYLYNPYLNRDKKDLLETLGVINSCDYDPKTVRLSHCAHNRI